MNERIDDLIEQCTEYWTDKGEEYFDKKKFAELIVKECLSLCSTSVGNKDYNTGRMHCYDNIKEHFGVEE